MFYFEINRILLDNLEIFKKSKVREVVGGGEA